jgi:uncharacterized protein YlxW (UPF0749 family)
VAAVSSHRSPRGPGRVDGSMSLLAEITQDSLDAAYAEHASRVASEPPQREQPPAGRTAPRRAAGVVLLVALGAVTGTAIDQVRDRAAASTDVRARLAAEVRATTAESDALAARAGALRAEVARTRDLALGADMRGRAAAARVADLALAAGAVPVVGPGIVVTVDDAEDASAAVTAELRGGRASERRITDRDLQGVVNGLWAVGAEAASVNGIRLTALTAIRSAGEAILVDFRPLSPPYVVEAIGEPERLEVDFLDGPVGRRFTTYAVNYGFGFAVRREDTLRLASSGEPDLRFAVPVAEPASVP